MYAVTGALIALAAPLGLLVVRLLLSGFAPDGGWLAAEWADEKVTYLYLLVSGPVLFGVLGAVLGRRQDKLAFESFTDPLTSLANRRWFDLQLEREVGRAVRYDSPLTLLLLDLDGLKDINDSGGHDAGDAALRSVGDSIRASVRSTDLGARIAGDEFAVLAPGTLAEDTLELAARIRANLHRAGLCTVSIGLADLGLARRQTADELMRSADLALYEAKDDGRDRAVVAALPSGVRRSVPGTFRPLPQSDEEGSSGQDGAPGAGGGFAA